MEEEIQTIEEDAIFAGVSSVNGQTGDVTLKTINGEALTGEGDIEIEVGVKSINNISPDEDGNVQLTAGDVGAATASDIATAVATKQDTLSASQLAATNSGITTAKVEQITTNAQEVTNNTADITAIEAKIPAQASSSNQLADKAFVNSSVSTNTANFVGTFNSLAELQAVQNPTNNDYGFVIGTDQAGNVVYNRYKYNGTAWVFEYALNNSSFTADQWAAIQSGITSGLVAKLNGIETGAEVNTIDSVSVNGTAVAPDANKNVNITIPAPSVVQTTGTSTTDVMSQNAVTSMVFADPSTTRRVQIGDQADANKTDAIAIGWRAYATANYAISIGWDSRGTWQGSIAIGMGANTHHAAGSIALGAYSGYSVTTGQRMAQGQMHIGTSSTGFGYNNSYYRLLSGLYDPQTDHDAATKGYVDTHLGGLSFVALTQTEYDALATKDPNTLYIIKAA